MIWIIVGVLAIIGILLALVLTNAVEGYEDAGGFHRVRK
jgi:type II secretory pathway pseudopilin PulG